MHSRLRSAPETMNAGLSWSKMEDDQLLQAIKEGKHITQISQDYKRTVKAIKCRLRLHAKTFIEDGKTLVETSKLVGLPVEYITKYISSKTVKEPEIENRSGLRWDHEEDDWLLRSISSGMTIQEIAEKHKRTIGGIEARLCLHATNYITKGKTLQEASDHVGLPIERVMEFIELKNKRTSSMVIEEILSADESREDKIYDLLRNIHERLIRIEAKLLISI